MDELKRIRDDIQKLREELEKLIEKKDGTWDDEIISTSKLLDAVLNEYDRLLMKKEK